MGERAAGHWTLPMVHAPPGSTQPSQSQLEHGDKIILGCKDQSYRVSREIWVTEMASLKACRSISQRGPAPQHFHRAHLEATSAPPPPFPMAAVCKACLAALPCTHCPWQLHRAGPRAQIMQPAQTANQAGLVGDSHQIKGPLPQHQRDKILPPPLHLV